MAYTYQDVENAGKKLLDDQDPGRRWEAADGIRWINQGKRQILALRPTARRDSTGAALLTITDATALTASIQIDDRFLMALAHYYCHHCLLQEGRNEFDRDLAAQHEKLFLETAKTA